MPAHLITGGLRNGKTLYTFANLKNWFGDRPIRYWNVSEVDIEYFKAMGVNLSPLTEPELRRYWEMDPLSVLLIDECHKVFPQRTKDKAPEFVEQFAEHGHQGIDFVLITQEEMAMDVFVRKRCEPYTRVKRIWGFQWAWIVTWPRYPQDGADLKNNASAKKLFRYPRWAYGKYHSARAHTVKGKVPFVAKLLVFAFVAFVPVAVWVAYTVFGGGLGLKNDDAKGVSSSKGVDLAGSQVGKVEGKGGAAPPKFVGVDYQRALLPRDSYQVDSGAIYDEVRKKVVIAPRVEGCVQQGDYCACWNNQGLRIRTMAVEVCRWFVARDFDGTRERAEVKVEQTNNHGMGGLGRGQQLPDGLSAFLPGLKGQGQSEGGK